MCSIYNPSCNKLVNYYFLSNKKLKRKIEKDRFPLILDTRPNKLRNIYFGQHPQSSQN